MSAPATRERAREAKDVLSVFHRRTDQVECPGCGAHVNALATECGWCGFTACGRSFKQQAGTEAICAGLAITGLLVALAGIAWVCAKGLLR